MSIEQMSIEHFKELIINSFNISKQLFLSILLLINIIIEAWRFYKSKKIKEIERKNQIGVLIDQRGIEIQEELYKKLLKLTYIDHKSDSKQLLKETKEITQYIDINNLYITTDIHKTVNNFLDYWKEVLLDSRKKSFEKERNFLRNYKHEFRK